MRQSVFANARVLPHARSGAGQIVSLRSTPGELTKLVFVYGARGRQTDYSRLLNELLMAGEHDVLVFNYNALKGNANQVARSLKEALQDILRLEPNARFILVGHSLGGVLLRRAIVDLYRDRATALDRIVRVVLLSSTNRGFEPVKISHSILRRFAYLIGYHPPILDGLRGSTWMTRLRIDWLETFGGIRIRPNFNEPSDGDVVTSADSSIDVPHHPVTIQIDGDRDRVVRPDDSAELNLFTGWVNQIVMKGVGHFDFSLASLDKPLVKGSSDNETSVATEADPADKIASVEALASEICAAVIGRRDPSEGRRVGRGFGLGRNLRGCTEITNTSFGRGTPGGWYGCGGNPRDLNIVFMIHGIRDYGSWHPVLGEALERRLVGAEGFWRIVPIEYGFFSALQFLLPVQQSRIVHGFVDRYLNELTRAFRLMLELDQFFPVRVHVAAHSNGSNILAQAIERDDEVSFSRVFLAGCVLRRDFWNLHSRRAYSVRNDCATNDWPVGVLCRFLGKIPAFGYWFLGAAGVDGFADPSSGSARASVLNNRWLTGDHGAAIEPIRIDTIAEYLVAGSPQIAQVNASRASSMNVERFSFFSLIFLTTVTLGGLLTTLSFLGGMAALIVGLSLILIAPALILIMLNV